MEVFNSCQLAILVSYSILSGRTKSAIIMSIAEPTNHLNQNGFSFGSFLGTDTLLGWKTNILCLFTKECYYMAGDCQKLQWCGKITRDGHRLNNQTDCLKDLARDWSTWCLIWKESTSFWDLPWWLWQSRSEKEHCKEEKRILNSSQSLSSFLLVRKSDFQTGMPRWI